MTTKETSLCAVFRRLPFNELSTQIYVSNGSKLFLSDSQLGMTTFRNQMDNDRYLLWNVNQDLYVNTRTGSQDKKLSQIEVSSRWNRLNDQGLPDSHAPVELLQKLDIEIDGIRDVKLVAWQKNSTLEFSNGMKSVALGQIREIRPDSQSDLYWSMWGIALCGLFEADFGDTHEMLANKFQKLHT